MIEIYKTNVKKREEAKLAIKKIKEKFPYLTINFDLEDCDKILRVENPKEEFDNQLLIQSIGELGFSIEILKDEYI